MAKRSGGAGAKPPPARKTVTSSVAAKRLAAALVEEGLPFESEPYPDDWWGFVVKAEYAQILERLAAGADAPNGLDEKRKEVARRRAKARLDDGENCTSVEEEFYSLVWNGGKGVGEWDEGECDEYLAAYDESGQSRPVDPAENDE